MDLLDRSGIDFGTLDCPVVLQVNGMECSFTQELVNNDQVVIRREIGLRRRLRFGLRFGLRRGVGLLGGYQLVPGVQGLIQGDGAAVAH